MRKLEFILAAVIFICISCLYGLNRKPVIIIPLEPQKLGAIVRLHDVGNGRFFCSGTVISPHLILTAAHCVVPDVFSLPRKVNVRSADGQDLNIYGMTLGADGRGDIALIGGNFLAFKNLDVEVRPYQNVYSYQNDAIAACGYPRAGSLFCTPFAYIEREGFQIKGTGTLWPGMSGGPVISLTNGKVIGVNTAVGGAFILVSDIVELYEGLGVSPE